MPPENTDKKIASLIYRAIVPKGLRPESPKDIEAILDTIGGEKLSDEMFHRMMNKIKGKEPIGVRQEEPLDVTLCDELSTADQELLAVYRNRGEDIPPEIQEKLDRMRKRARQEERKDEIEDEE